MTTERASRAYIITAKLTSSKQPILPHMTGYYYTASEQIDVMKQIGSYCDIVLTEYTISDKGNMRKIAQHKYS